MRYQRHAKILEIIEMMPIGTQEELLERLGEAGYCVTQATVSRDIKSLRLIKTLDKDGVNRYTVLRSEERPLETERFFTLFRDTVLRLDRAANIVVVKCYAGMANATCAALDSMSFPEVVGTLSGDDTFFILLHGEEEALQFEERLRGYLG